MPKNRFIYIGVLVVAACALLYVSFEFTKFVQPILPWAAGVGALFIVLGIFMESKSRQAAAQLAQGLKPGESAADNVRETRM